ncbi:hypothetical protein [Flexivirga caeni]|uniref:Uncharacterized protein n=1 Tax=Flexivirga caeni TaxID=2294115 RepID=A0A3M9MI33_9MICO|nr:hypothetical protein [Flexivirga caeni]RNI25154.1 hypothetical protein EFY87_00445 [Flexivirga caeni]
MATEDRAKRGKTFIDGGANRQIQALANATRVPAVDRLDLCLLAGIRPVHAAEEQSQQALDAIEASDMMAALLLLRESMDRRSGPTYGGPIWREAFEVGSRWVTFLDFVDLSALCGELNAVVVRFPDELAGGINLMSSPNRVWRSLSLLFNVRHGRG